MSELERGIVEEMSKIRTDPTYLIPHLENFLSGFKGSTYYAPGSNCGLMTQEGTNAVREAINFCRNADPVGPLKWNEHLHKAATYHCQDTGPQGITGHNSTNGDDMSSRLARFGQYGGTCGENCSYGEGDAIQCVMQLFIDDGVSSRGHRSNIMKPEFKVAGAGVGPHQGYEMMTVQDFATTFTGTGDAPQVDSSGYTPKPKQELKPQRVQE